MTAGGQIDYRARGRSRYKCMNYLVKAKHFKLGAKDHGARRVWRGFCSHGTNFIACWRDRATSLNGATNLSPVTKLVAGNGAVSRYNLSRSQKFIMVQDLNCVQMHVSGCKNNYKAV